MFFSIPKPCLKYRILLLIILPTANFFNLTTAEAALGARYEAMVDREPPEGTISINDNAVYTNSRAVRLALSASDAGRGMGQGAQMRFSNNGANWSWPEAYAVSKNWNLTAGNGQKRVYVRFKDVAGNWSEVFSDAIILDTTPPGPPRLNQVVTPTGNPVQRLSGTKEINTSVWLNNQQIIPLDRQTPWSYNKELSVGNNPLSIYCKDRAGNSSNVLRANIFYDATPPEQLQVIDDGDSTISRTELHARWQAQDPETAISEYQYSIGTAQGANDIVNWASAGVNTEVTVNNLALRPGSTYYFNLKAVNTVGLWSNIASSDGITIQNQPPEILSLTPQNNSKFNQGDAIEINLRAQDADGDSLEYRYLVNGQVIQEWTPQASYAWQTQAGDVRLKTIRVEVRDEFGATSSQETHVFLFRRIPEPG